MSFVFVQFHLLSMFAFSDTFHMLEDSQQVFKEVMCNTHAMLGAKICCNCTLTECLNRCLDLHSPSATCDGVDYDVMHAACYYHDNRGMCFKPRFKMGVYQVRRTTCPTGIAKLSFSKNNLYEFGWWRAVVSGSLTFIFLNA